MLDDYIFINLSNQKLLRYTLVKLLVLKLCIQPIYTTIHTYTNLLTY